MFDTALVTLTADVATNGTFTLSYPVGKSAGSYTNSHKHLMFALQSKYTAPEKFTLSFGATLITVTYIGTTTLPAGTPVRLQLDTVGADSKKPYGIPTPVNVIKVPVVRVDLGAPAATSANAIATSQSVAAAAAFVINGTLLSGSRAVLDVPRNVVAAWTTTSVLTITGKDVAGNVVVEQSASGASHTGTKAFKEITSITSSASITGATVGTGGKLGLPVAILAAEQILSEYQDGVILPRPAGKVFLPFEIEATELAAGTAEQLVSPVAGYINKVRGTIQSAVTTGGPVTVEINGTAVTGLTFTVADAAAAGTRYSDAPTTRHASDSLLAAGDKITVTPDASFATAGQLNGVIEIDTTGAGLLEGTLVAAVLTKATATTGDTRGTYTPSTTLDGAISFSLLVALSDPLDAGVDQYAG